MRLIEFILNAKKIPSIELDKVAICILALLMVKKFFMSLFIDGYKKLL